MAGAASCTSFQLCFSFCSAAGRDHRLSDMGAVFSKPPEAQLGLLNPLSSKEESGQVVSSRTDCTRCGFS